MLTQDYAVEITDLGFGGDMVIENDDRTGCLHDLGQCATFSSKIQNGYITTGNIWHFAVMENCLILSIVFSSMLRGPSGTRTVWASAMIKDKIYFFRTWSEDLLSVD
jgi:hypothetical protein